MKGIMISYEWDTNDMRYLRSFITRNGCQYSTWGFEKDGKVFKPARGAEILKALKKLDPIQTYNVIEVC